MTCHIVECFSFCKAAIILPKLNTIGIFMKLYSFLIRSFLKHYQVDRSHEWCAAEASRAPLLSLLLLEPPQLLLHRKPGVPVMVQDSGSPRPIFADSLAAVPGNCTLLLLLPLCHYYSNLQLPVSACHCCCPSQSRRKTRASSLLLLSNLLPGPPVPEPNQKPADERVWEL